MAFIGHVALFGSSLYGVGRGLAGPAPRDGRSPLSCGRGACGFVGNASALSTNPQARPRLQHQETERSRQLVPPIRLYRASASQPTHVRLPTQNSEEPTIAFAGSIVVPFLDELAGVEMRTAVAC